jgi:Xaa-Pro aminopeptidase
MFLITDFYNIKYLTGFGNKPLYDEQEVYLLVNDDKKYAITDSRYTLELKEKLKEYKVIDFTESNLTKAIKDIIAENEIDTLYFEKSISFRMYDEVLSKLEVNIIAQDKYIEDKRITKEKKEIDSISKACTITREVLETVQEKIDDGISEKDLADYIVSEMIKKGAEDVSFEPIVVSGNNSAIVHGMPSDKMIEDGELIICDVGCKVNGYCSDMTRTFKKGILSNEQEDIYYVVREAQQRARDAIEVGMELSELDKVAREYIEEEGYGEYFLHSLGHGVGLNVHEAPAVSKRSKDILKEGMVITIEPGIYIEGLGGVRIEDTMLVTKDGGIALTRK